MQQDRAGADAGRSRPTSMSVSALATAQAISVGSLHHNGAEPLLDDAYAWSLAPEHLPEQPSDEDAFNTLTAPGAPPPPPSSAAPERQYRYSSSSSSVQSFGRELMLIHNFSRDARAQEEQLHDELEDVAPPSVDEPAPARRKQHRDVAPTRPEAAPAGSSVDWVGGRGLATGTLSTRHEPPVDAAPDALHISCDDTVLEFGMETEMGEEEELAEQPPGAKWPHEHHQFEQVAVFSWTLVSLASVARRHAAGRHVDSPPLQAPEQPTTRWLVRLFPSGLPDNERAHMVTSFGCLSLDPSLGGAAVARVTLEAETAAGPTGCEYMTLLSPGLFHCADFLLPRHGAPRDLHLTVRVAWSGFPLPPLLAAPPPVHGLVTRFDTGRVLRRRRHDSYQVRVRAVWRVHQFTEWRPPRGTQLVSPLFGCNAVVWSLQLWPNGGRAADPEGFLRVVVHLLHLPAAMREEGVRVSLRVNDGPFRNTVPPLREDGSWGCLAGPRRLIPLATGGALNMRVELWYDSPANNG